MPFCVFSAIRYILWQFGIFNGYLVYFSCFCYGAQKKIWQPCFRPGANPTNASAVKIYSAMSSLVHLKNENIVFYIRKNALPILMAL
jgi:hypothetical protein